MERKCRKCGRDLTDPDSRVKGYGPVCDQHHVWKPDISIYEALRRPIEPQGLMRRTIAPILKRIMRWYDTH
jgi:hypothetical protein